jgi:hypothetical protein
MLLLVKVNDKMKCDTPQMHQNGNHAYHDKKHVLNYNEATSNFGWHHNGLGYIGSLVDDHVLR